MNNNSYVKIFASRVAPDPAMDVLWLDLSSGDRGSTVKYWTGAEYDPIQINGELKEKIDSITAKLGPEDIDNVGDGSIHSVPSSWLLDQKLSLKVDHGYSPQETVKTLRDVDTKIDAVDNKIDSLKDTEGGYASITNGIIPEQYVPGFREAFSAREDFPSFSGNTLYITDKSLPTVINNIFVYVDGALLKPLDDYSIQDDIITLTLPLVNKDVSVIWFLNREEYWRRAPSKILDASVSLISTRSAIISFSAGGAYGNQGICPEYKVYYSKTILTIDNYKLADSHTIKNNAIYGWNVKIAIKAIEPGSIYYAFVVGISSGNEGDPSNLVTFKTTDLNLPSSVGYVLPINQNRAYDHLHKVSEIPTEAGGVLGDYYKPKYMVNGDIILENNQVSPESDPGEFKFKMSYTGFKSAWPNMSPYELIFDLESVKRVDRIFLYYEKATNINIYVSQVGSNFAYVGSLGGYNNRLKWLSVQVPVELRLARYIKLDFKAAEEINEIVVVGSVLSGSLPSGSKVSKGKKAPRFEYLSGTNGFYTNIVEDVAKFGRRNRFYSTWQWWLPQVFTSNPNLVLLGDTTEGKQQVYYDFTSGYVQGNMDNVLSRLKNAVNEYYGEAPTSNYVCFKQPLKAQWLKSDGTIDEWNNVKNNRNQDYSIYPQYGSRDPMAYRMFAQFLYTVSARYGRESNNPDHLLAIGPSNSRTQGMDLLKYIEVENEPDRDARGGTEAYYHPEELAAMMSACYDGHMGTLGPGFGIKQADTSMMMVFPGITGQDVGYIKRVMMWFEANRLDPNYPTYAFDVISFHYYHNNTGGQTNVSWRKGISPDSVSPNKKYSEGGTLFDAMKFICDWRDREAPGVEVWLGESGYDEQPQSLQSIFPQQNRSITLLKADYLMRTLLHCAAAGIDAFHQYMYRNDTQLSVLLYVSYQNTYLGSGYVDYLTNTQHPDGSYLSNTDPAKYPPLPSYYYVLNLLHHLKGMRFSHIIRIAKKTYTKNVILNISDGEAIENVCALAFVPDSDDPSITKSTCLVLWLGQEEYADTTARIAIASDESLLNATYFEGSEINTQSKGTQTTLPYTIDNNIRCVDVPINGTPCILWTKAIGKPPIEAPELNSYVINSTTARLYWKDKNEEYYAVCIYRYDAEIDTYTEIFKDYIYQNEYDIQNLAPGVSHRYMIKFVSLNDPSLEESDYSNEVVFTTPSELPEVYNLQQSMVSYNKLSFTWEYDQSAEEVTEGFRIYKSNTPTGQYDVITEIGSGSREFTYYGLSEDSQYYYKVAPYSPIASGNLSGFVGITTLAINFQSPSVIAAKTDYFGTRVSLFFDIPLSANMLIDNNITIYDSNNGDPRIISVSSLNYDSMNYKLELNLSSNIEYSTSTILIGYDGAGTLFSQYNIPVLAFEDYPVVNNYLAASLISNRYKVSLNNNSSIDPDYEPFNVPEEDGTWNQFISQNGYVDNIIDANGDVSSVTFGKIKHSVKWNGLTADPGSAGKTNRSFIVDEFDTWVNGAGGQVNAFLSLGSIAQSVSFHGLNPDKDYMIKYMATSSGYNSRESYIKEYLNYEEKRIIDISNNVSKFFMTSKIDTVIAPITPTSAISTSFSLPSVFLGFQSVISGTAAQRETGYITAVILIEVNKESLDD